MRGMKARVVAEAGIRRLGRGLCCVPGWLVGR